MVSHWIWATASAAERGVWVRDSFRHCRYDIAKLCDLFNLTQDGAERILSGESWRPEFERPDINYLEP